MIAFWTDPASATDASTPAGILVFAAVVVLAGYVWSRHDRTPVAEPWLTHAVSTGAIPPNQSPSGDLGPILDVLTEAARYRHLRWNVELGWAGSTVTVCSDAEPVRVYRWSDGDTMNVAAAIWSDWCDPAAVEALP